MATRRNILALGITAVVADVLPQAAEASDSPDFLSFYVWDTGHIAWEHEAWAIRHTTASVIGYELIGMPETWDVYESVAVDPPVPMAEWLNGTKFSKDNWQCPWFVRVYYDQGVE